MIPKPVEAVDRPGHTVTRRYKNPSVHEVILDVQFHDSVGERELRDVRKRLAERFERVDEQSTVEILMSVGPHGQDVQTGRKRFAGWLFRSEPPGWALRTAAQQVTLHAVRPGKWPIGDYVGWSAIFAHFKELYEALTTPYGALKTKRVGLRYLNRIAIPKGVDLDDWLFMPLAAPGPLKDLYAFNLQHTWASAGEYDDISARIAFQKIDIEEPKVAEHHDGVLLDIDVFNLWIPKAPVWSDLLDWYERAHTVENQVFERSITDRLRSQFDQ